jgi:hypothetical protein
MMKMVKQMLALFVMVAFVNVSAETAYVRILGKRNGPEKVEIDENATVADLKEAIMHQIGIPIELQERIIFANKYLGDNGKLLTEAIGGKHLGHIFYVKLKQ